MLEQALKILKEYYGYDSFKHGQENVITNILERRDTVAIMPTGAGKSLCYQVPALLLDGVTIVISPLISLMKDQVDTLKAMGIPATFINSSLTISEIRRRIDDVSQNKYKLLYIAPERLEADEFIYLMKELNISFIAIDEAHCISQWGHDFRPSYRHISSFIGKLPNRPIIAAFTATATQEVKEDIVHLLKLQESSTYVTGFNRENLYFSVIRGENKKDYILDYVQRNKDKVGIIYAATRKEVESIYKDLEKAGFNPAKYHAGLSKIEREQNQEAFLFDNSNIIVATNAFGMGIDKSNVRYVLHYNLPKNMEAYYQEAGRAGRDGEPSECILLFGPQDIMIQKFMIEQSVMNPERKENEYHKLQQMVDYCYTPNCLRHFILDYFGEEDPPKTCDNCSTCTDSNELVDITEDALKIFSCIIRLKERFGSALVAQVLKGSKNKRVVELGFHGLPTYGVMENYTEKEIRDIMNILVADGYLQLTNGQYPVLRMTKKSVGVLKNGEKVYQRIQRKSEKLSEDNTLFELLRKLRKEISITEKIPPYVVFSDSTLRDMSKYYPIEPNDLLSIKGVGQNKLEKYGDMFLEVIKKYVDDNEIMIERIYQEEVADKERVVIKEKKPSHLVTYEFYQLGLSIEEIAQQREITVITIQNHILQCASEGLAVDLDSFIPQEHERLILQAVDKIGKDKLKPIKELLPQEVSYLTIKAVLTKYQS